MEWKEKRKPLQKYANMYLELNYYFLFGPVLFVIFKKIISPNPQTVPHEY